MVGGSNSIGYVAGFHHLAGVVRSRLTKLAFSLAVIPSRRLSYWYGFRHSSIQSAIHGSLGPTPSYPPESSQFKPSNNVNGFLDIGGGDSISSPAQLTGSPRHC